MTKPQTRQTHLALAALIALVALLALGAQAHAKKYLYVFHFDELTYNGITYPADGFSFTSPALIGPTEIPGSPFIDSLTLASPLDLNGFSFSTIRCNSASWDYSGNLIGIGFTTDLTYPFTVGQVSSFEARISFPPGAYGPGFYTSDSFARAIAFSSGGLTYQETTGSLDITEVTGYKFTTINVPDGSDTIAWGINDAGQIVGEFPADSSDARGFLLSGGEYTFIEYSGALNTHPTGISNAGWIVGGYQDLSLKKHGFLWNVFIPPFDAPYASNTSAWGINNTGKIVGEYDDSTGTHGFLWENGLYTTLDHPQASSTKAFGINNAVQIVGSYGSTGTHGFLRENGLYTSLDFPGASYTEARGINNAGQIVGLYIDGTRVNGFLWSDGNYTPIKVPGATYTAAYGINNAGQIVGAYYDGTATHGFLATPIHPIIPSIMLLLE